MGAIIFGKVARTQCFASTAFSDPIVVRYGTGLLSEAADDSSSAKSLEERDERNLPCPMLEFRVINRMHSAGGGEILNCTLNVVASISESKATESLLDAVLHKSHRKKKLSMGIPGGKMAGGIVAGTAKQVGKVASGTAKMAGTIASDTAKQVGKATGTTKIVSGTAKQVGSVAGSVKSGVTHAAGSLATGVSTQAGKVTCILKNTLIGTVEENKAYDPDEGLTMTGSDGSLQRKNMYAASLARASKCSSVVDEGSHLIPRRIFSNLEVETPAHPFFKRVWNVRHVLDQNSPLLSVKAKEMIIENNGFWPEALNSYEAIRENLHFHEIIVNLSGTANATGSVVYSQKVYSFVDVNIGYTFVNVLRRQNDGRISVDVGLLNDVVEQYGGGGEPFTDVAETDFLGAALGAAGNVADNAISTARNVADRAQDQIGSTAQNVTTGTKKSADAVKDNIVGTTQNVSDFTKETVVQFKEAVTDAVAGRAKSSEAPHTSEQTGEKKDL